MKRKYQLINPNNARITIDYKNKEEPVKFDYVMFENPYRISIGSFLSAWWSTPYLYVVIALCTIAAGISYGMHGLTDEQTLQPYLFNIWLLILFIPPLILGLLFGNKKIWLKHLPDVQFKYLNGKHYNKTFEPKEVLNNQVNIPLFKNIGLDYHATQEMSKYLERVEIKEHDFKLVEGKKITDPQPYLWKATFYFSKKPLTGQIHCRFK